MNINFFKVLTFFMPRPNMIFLMNIHIYNMFYILYTILCSRNKLIRIRKSILQIDDINSKSLLFIFYIGITFAILKSKICIIVQI